MASNRARQQRRQVFKQPLERRVDKLIETGLQVVDGVAGTRPGVRRSHSTRLSASSLDKVGRWVGDKLDWFLEDEDDWMEPWQSDDSQTFAASKKRPLDAISRRAPKNTKSDYSSFEGSRQNSETDEWPEESSFRVDKWQRGQEPEENVDSARVQGSPRESNRLERRSLPRSNRRRY